MNRLLYWLVLSLLTAPVIVPFIVVASWRHPRWARIAWGAIAVLFISWLSYGVEGMNYEDFDRPFPWWFSPGMNTTWIEIGLVALALSVRGWPRLRAHVQPTKRSKG